MLAWVCGTTGFDPGIDAWYSVSVSLSTWLDLARAGVSPGLRQENDCVLCVQLLGAGLHWCAHMYEYQDLSVCCV